MRFLLLNPPASRNYSRDCFIGTVVEPDVALPPVDLAMLSGRLSELGEVAVLDAQAEGLAPAAAVARARATAPDFVFFLTSGASYVEDSAFLEALKTALPRARLAGIGDLYLDMGEAAFQLQPFLDAALYDFAGADLAGYVSGSAGQPLENLAYRAKGGAVVRGPVRRRYGEWSSPAPRWDLFPLACYRWPFSPEGPRASLSTDYGCPFLCTYCPASALGHRTRPLEDVLAEARGLKALGARAVFIRDQTFAAHRGRAFALLEALAREKLGLSWTASTRVDLVDAALLSAMKKAGFSSVSFGIDTGSQELARAYKKGTTRAQAAEAAARAREAGLKTWGVFVIGLSMDTRETIEETVAAARELGLDRVSVRVESSRYAAGYRRELLVRGFVPPESMPPDVPTTTSVWQGRLGISNDGVFDHHAKAIEEFSRN